MVTDTVVDAVDLVYLISEFENIRLDIIKVLSCLKFKQSGYRNIIEILETLRLKLGLHTVEVP